MSAYEDAFKLEQGASAETLAAAARILAHAGGVVLLEGAVALRSTGHELRCEVVDPMHSAHLCAHEYEVMVENARRPLEASGLAALLPDLPRTWLVVDDSGADTRELWRAP